ncbi:hypothetical protein [Nocardioides pelophilus]|uniref:hypothetical protein n=1 Tax=Nocardioides pelophilus TaxID=2172019 RepID=UPI0016034F34|nr:hypothetical protein [Nocardioides pelophilus]
MKIDTRRAGRLAATFLAYGAVAALVSAPLAAERAVEAARFDDRIGTVPVEVSLTHNGVSTLDTGVLGSLYWEQTGAAGFGAEIRVTGAPEAGGTLSSYVSPRFVQANAAFVNDPGEVARAYGEELEQQFWRRFLWWELAALLVGGGVLTGVFRGRPRFPAGVRRPAAIALGTGAVALATAASVTAAAVLFDRWEGNVEVAETYPMPGVDGLSFSSPEALEVARQVQPFLEKNSSRIRARTAEYERAAEASLRIAFADRADDLAPQEGERIIIAEADPQGSLVGTAVRTTLYRLLVETLGAESFVMRTISGDITSNGTVAEAGFVEDEAAASGPIPTVAVKGDHDTDITVDQLIDNDVANPDFDPTDVDGIEVVAANDPAFKTLFGGLVINESGVSETELGAALRDEIDRSGAGPVVVLLHQPASVAGYLGVEDLDVLDDAAGRETSPYDDGIPDLPPGIINIGHLHDPAAPQVIWNTDGDEVTWTVVNQLGTSGGVEESPTYNRFSTPFSVPLKPVSVQLQYVDVGSGLQTGYATIELDTDGDVTVSERRDLGL